MKYITALLSVLTLAVSSMATTWGESVITDPLTGDKVPSHEWITYGSYIYNWPSKYDLVFWPLADINWITINVKNGYAAFNDDFEKVPEEEKKKLIEWLSNNYNPSKELKTFEEQLEWLEKVYCQRSMNDDFWCRFYRLMAYAYEQNPEKSLEYVRKAMPLLETKLNTNSEGVQRIETLFLLGEYNRRMGEKEKSQNYFSQVKEVKFKDKNGAEQVGHPYFLNLIKDREQPTEQKKPDNSK
jgi:tetratricopeptide (TPR) repeat protein